MEHGRTFHRTGCLTKCPVSPGGASRGLQKQVALCTLAILEHEMASMVLEAPGYSWVQVHAGPCTLGGTLHIEFSSALVASEGP